MPVQRQRCQFGDRRRRHTAQITVLAEMLRLARFEARQRQQLFDQMRGPVTADNNIVKRPLAFAVNRGCRATCAWIFSAASGVRSSWAASAVNRRSLSRGLRIRANRRFRFSTSGATSTGASVLQGREVFRIALRDLGAERGEGC